MDDFKCNCGSTESKMMFPTTAFIYCLGCGLVYVKDSYSAVRKDVSKLEKNDGIDEIKKELGKLQKEIKILKTFKRRL